jgi:hypothetical protein
MKNPKMLVSATARAEAQYQATLVGVAVRQALWEDRQIRTGQRPEVTDFEPFDLPQI